MGHRIRAMLHSGSFEKLTGEVGVDETFIGGKARNMHAARRRKRRTGRGGTDKTAALGVLQRGGEGPGDGSGEPAQADATAPRQGTRRSGFRVVLGRVEVLPGSRCSLRSRCHQPRRAVRRNGKIHTNGMENFWSLLKRGLSGTYVSIEPFHLFRYLDEQAYRYNERHGNDLDRFRRALARVVGRRLTYDELTGQYHEPRAIPV